MHCIDEGITLKFLSLLKNSRRLMKITVEDYTIINKSLKIALKTQPKEFNRRIRTLDCLGFWKASENRTFLLYAGVVALKILDDAERSDIYRNFLTLSMACRICSFEGYEHFLDVAEVMFNDFVDNFTILFGISNTTWKIHSARHMVDEVRRHGLFKEFSAYRFESFMNTVQKALHSHTLPLQQLHRRTVEIYKSQLLFSAPKQNNLGIKFGKVVKAQSVICFSFVWLNGTYISNNFKDSWFMLQTKDIVKIEKILCSDSGIPNFIVSKLVQKQNFFIHPLESSLLGIFKGMKNNFEKETFYCKPKELKCKLFSIQTVENENEYVFIPMSDIEQ